MSASAINKTLYHLMVNHDVSTVNLIIVYQYGPPIRRGLAGDSLVSWSLTKERVADGRYHNYLSPKMISWSVDWSFSRMVG